MSQNRYAIESEDVRIEAMAKGAELVSLYHKIDKIEYMWSGNSEFWSKHSPVLFPIVGTLKSNTYYYAGKSYHLGRHGFARDRLFTPTVTKADELRFTLESDAETLRNFPFEFRFDIIYRLQNNRLSVIYQVTNTGGGEMYFSVGAHPAFRVPIIEGTNYNDYFLEFSTPELAGRWPISAEGLIEASEEPLLTDTTRLPLHKELFYRDALVFKNLRSNTVRLRSSKHAKGFELKFPGFPFLGIWAAKDADFVCIEPWCGISDSVNSSQQLRVKEGINILNPGKTFERSWEISVGGEWPV